jgi:pyridoxine 4-dehydrogenase
MSIPKTITIAANNSKPLTVNRLGYGTMRLTGPEIYGDRITARKRCKY